MTVYISARRSRWCLLADVGGARSSHVTACGARMDASDPYCITGTPPAEDVCLACRAIFDNNMLGVSR